MLVRCSHGGHCQKGDGGAFIIIRSRETTLSSSARQVASQLLLAFDGLEKALKISRAESGAALALDDLQEDSGAVLDGLREELE